MKLRVVVALFLFVISFSVVRAQEMIFYEPFDNTSTIDGNGGSYSGGVVFGNGVLGNSVQFSSFTIDYPVVDNLDINQGTVSFWVRPIAWNTGGNGGNGFFDIGNLGSAASFAVFRNLAQNYVYFEVRDDSVSQRIIQKSNAVSIGEWTNIAIVYRFNSGGSDVMKLYVDGVLAMHWEPMTIPFHPPDSIFTVGDVGWYEGANSYIDELKAYNYMRSSAEIKDDYDDILEKSKPKITSYDPEKDNIFCETGNITFDITATSANPLIITWYLDDSQVGTGDNYTVDCNSLPYDSHSLKVIASDDNFQDEHGWGILKLYPVYEQYKDGNDFSSVSGDYATKTHYDGEYPVDDGIYLGRYYNDEFSWSGGEVNYTFLIPSVEAMNTKEAILEINFSDGIYSYGPWEPSDTPNILIEVNSENIFNITTRYYCTDLNRKYYYGQRCANNFIRIPIPMDLISASTLIGITANKGSVFEITKIGIKSHRNKPVIISNEKIITNGGEFLVKGIDYAPWVKGAGPDASKLHKPFPKEFEDVTGKVTDDKIYVKDYNEDGRIEMWEVIEYDMEMIKMSGSNTIRTYASGEWHDKNRDGKVDEDLNYLKTEVLQGDLPNWAFDRVLDYGLQNDVKTIIGYWVQEEDCKDDDNITAGTQMEADLEDLEIAKETFGRVVVNYYDHPSVVAWGIGNEVHLPDNHNWFNWTLDINLYLDELNDHVRSIDDLGKPAMYTKYVGEEIDFDSSNADIIAVNAYTHGPEDPDLIAQFAVGHEQDECYLIGEYAHEINHTVGHWELAKKYAGGCFLEYSDVWWEGFDNLFGIVNQYRNIKHERWDPMYYLYTSLDKTCIDGTLYGLCSLTRPLYCNNGVLENNCGICGCESGGICALNSLCEPLGDLGSYLVNPLFAIEVEQNNFFSISTGVRCDAGYCGNIRVILDPIKTGEDAVSLSTIDVGKIEEVQKKVDDLNKEIKEKGKRWKAGITQPAFYSDEEKQALLSATINNTDVESFKGYRLLGAVDALPGEFDWRNKDGINWLTPVKDQAFCGSCWAFAAVGAMEAVFNVKPNNPENDLDLSEQELVSCSSAGTCLGGHSYLAFDYIKEEGIVDEQCFTYSASDEACLLCFNADERKTKVYEYMHVVNTEEEYKKALVEHGPFVVGLDAYEDLFYYSSGIYEPLEEEVWDGVLNHAVVLVGYNDSGSYWIIKNSWGVGWGEQGYARVAYGNLVKYDYGYAITGIEFPGIIPMYNGTPFYTITRNPGICWDMKAGDSCNMTWVVNATGNGTYEMFTKYVPYIGYINRDNTERVNVTINVSEECVDDDGDGFYFNCGLVDCDDDNVSIYPGALELCNNVDDDCDEFTDEDLSQACGSGDCLGVSICSAGVWGDCSSSGSDCGVCALCALGGSCVYDETQDDDCNKNDVGGIATCFYNPDGINVTFDYYIGFNSGCVGIGICSEAPVNWEEGITHECDKVQCFAGCDSITLCKNNACSETYDDYCNNRRLVEYDDDRVLDSTTIEDSCVNDCLRNCSCTDCGVDCSAPTTNEYCVKDVCGAECSVDGDCDDGNPSTMDSCLANCTCYYGGAGSCVVPIDGMAITEDTLFCKGSYSLPSGIIINASNVVLDCGGAVLNGSNVYKSSGINVSGNNNLIRNCDITGFYYGIWLDYSDNNTALNNHIYSNNNIGIRLYYSNNISIINNLIVGNGAGISSFESNYTIIMDNEVFSNRYVGISVSSGQVVNNTIHNNNDSGIITTSGANIIGNTIYLNGDAAGFWGEAGIKVDSGQPTIRDNDIHNNINGIILYRAYGARLRDNLVYSNTDLGIYSFGGDGHNLTGNRIYGNGKNFGVSEYYPHNYVDTSNLVNGRPIYYLLDQRDIKIFNSAGYIALVNCTNCTVSNQEISNNYECMLLVKTDNSKILGNNIGYCNNGIHMYYSNNTKILNNTITNCEYDGIYSDYSSYLSVINNNIIGNRNGIDFYHCPWPAGCNGTINYNNILSDNCGIWRSESLGGYVNAENNWWGVMTEDEVSNLMCGDYSNLIDFDPWLYGPFDGNQIPVISNLECQSDGLWEECSNLESSNILTRVRVNCTDMDGSITNVVFELRDISDYQTISIGNGTFDSGYWVYDNDNLLLDYDGLILLATCVDNSLGKNSLSKSWSLGSNLIFYEGFEDIDSIYNNNGTIEGNIKFTETRCGRAGNLTSDSYISYPLRGNFPNATNLTIEFWFKNTKLSSQGFFDIARLYGTHPNSMGIFYSTSVNRVITEIRNNITGMYQAHAPGSLIGYKWYHVAMTFSDYDTKNNCFMTTTYFNGNPGEDVRVCNFYPNISNDFWVGSNYYYGYGNAYMDEFKIFNYAKPDDEIYNDYLYMRNCTKEEMSKKNCSMYKPESLGKVKVNCSGLYVDDKPFTAKGIGYQPIPIGETANKEGGADIIFNTPEIYNRDFPLLREMNANTIRTWAKVTNISFLDAAWNNGVDPIYVVMGFWINCDDNYGDSAIREGYISNFTAYVNEFKDHPAVLAWVIGNEVNLCGNPSYIDEYYTLANDMAKAAYEAEGSRYHPVGIINWDIYHIGWDVYNSNDETQNYTDFWGSNVYPGETFGTWFDAYSGLSGKPLLITEYGIDALNNTNKREYEDVHAEWVLRQWNEINASNVTIGSTLMAYSDEWWKSGNNWGHDYGGYTPAAHPDNFANEEWWGVMRSVRNLSGGVDIIQPREVYYALRDVWGETTRFDLPLNQGWNLISIPLILPDTPAPSIINYTIFGYNGSWFVPEDIDTKLGYWIKVDEPMIISFNGVEVTDKDIDLNNGWNLVGHPYLEEKDVSELFANDSVYGYNGSWPSYVSGRTVNSLQTLKPGYGYWVRVQ